MKKSGRFFVSFLFILIILAGLYFSLMPQWTEGNENPPGEFSVKRALSHIRELSAYPHYTSSEPHDKVSEYLQGQLRSLGLDVKTESGVTLTDGGYLVRSRNIMARIKGSGSGKALLLLSHYDSAPHSSSPGAADNAAGVAVILESVRAFLHNKTSHKNDIIILFTDAEELGLNGASLFVTKNKWAKEIGLALNFEARGTAGPGYMLIEVTQGNSAMVDAFAEANPRYPVSNSLMYSIYKMMPNDTDLTVFRESGNIQGFNFAFIDDHFNYHTSQDNLSHLSPKTIAHQASYLMPLLKYFSNSNLDLKTNEEQVYFNIPLVFVHYPFALIYPMLIITAILFIAIVFIGLGKRTIDMSGIARGFIPFTGALALSGIMAFFGWKILLSVYPQYNDIQQGFTYNGHDYIGAFTCLSIAIAFACYGRQISDRQTMNYSVAPISVFLLINAAIAAYLPGAGFFILPVIASLLMLGIFVASQKASIIANTILAVPALVILVPFIIMFPIGLGLKILAGSAILTVLLFTLLLPVFGLFRKKWLWAITFFIISLGFFMHAHLHSGYDAGTARPNSLLYIYNADNDKAVWASYDAAPDQWTKIYLGDNPKSAEKLNQNPLYSKYGSLFTFTADALVRDVKEPTIVFVLDSTIGKFRHLKIRITPNRKVNRYDIFSNNEVPVFNLIANGASQMSGKSLYAHTGKRLFSYYVVNNEPLLLSITVPAKSDPGLELMESSFDLMRNPLFQMQPRKSWMMPTPFVLNDAIAIVKKILPAPKVPVPLPVTKSLILPTAEIDTIPDADAEPAAEALPNIAKPLPSK